MKNNLLKFAFASNLIAIFLLLVVLVSNENKNVFILAITALSGMYYAWETNRMRKEMVHENEIRTQPFPLLFVREIDKKLMIKNAGKGIANKVEFNETDFIFKDIGKVTLRFSLKGIRYLLPSEQKEINVKGIDAHGNDITSEDFIRFLFNPEQPTFDTGIQIKAWNISDCPYLFTIRIDQSGTYVSEIKKGVRDCNFD